MVKQLEKENGFVQIMTVETSLPVLARDPAGWISSHVAFQSVTPCCEDPNQTMADATCHSIQPCIPRRLFGCMPRKSPNQDDLFSNFSESSLFLMLTKNLNPFLT